MSQWREIRALRADPPGLAATDEARSKEFGASLQQAEEFAEAAAGSGYSTKPLQLYYGLSQGFRAVCAAHLTTDWRRLGHGLTFAAAETQQLIDAVVKPAPRAHDLHAGAMSVFGEQPLPKPITIGKLMAALIEFREVPIPGDDSPRPLLLLNPLQRHHVVPGDGPEPAPVLLFAVAGLPEGADAEALIRAIEPYPALAGAVPTAWPDGSYRMGGVKVGGRGRSEQGGVAYFHADVPGGSFPVFQLPFGTGNPAEYRAAFEQLGISHPNDPLLRIAQPAFGEARQLGTLCPWWALLLGLSSLARYHASQWAGALALDEEPLTPALERVIDLAEDLIPLYLLDALTGASGIAKRTPALDDSYIVREG